MFNFVILMEYEFIEIDFLSKNWINSIWLRYKILRKPLNLDYSYKDLIAKKDEFQLGVLYKRNIIACLLLKKMNINTLKMRQVAVEEAWQSKGIGTYMVSKTEEFSISKGFESIILNARKTAVPFYLRQNYEIISEEFLEVGIPHFTMQKILKS